MDPVDFGCLRERLEACEQDLARERTAREQSDHGRRLLELFIGALAHDLRTPLQTIILRSRALLCHGMDAAAQRSTERILAGAEHASRLVTQLLDFARARAGEGIPLRREPVDLVGLCCQAMEEVEVLHPDVGLRLSRRGDTQGEWDEGRILEVLLNLIDNAARYGRPDRAVRISVEGSGGEVSMRVNNAGAVPLDALPTIFDPFRGGSPRRPHGLGLGLFIAQQIVLAHGGRIDVTSSEEEGTTFCVSLPRSAAAAT